MASTAVACGCTGAMARTWVEHCVNGLVPSRHSFRHRELTTCAPACYSYFNCLPYPALACPLIAVYFSKHSQVFAMAIISQIADVFLSPPPYLSKYRPYFSYSGPPIELSRQISISALPRQIPWHKAKQRDLLPVLFRWYWIRWKVLGTGFIPRYCIVQNQWLLIKCHPAS